MKKILSLVLALLMTFSAASIVGAAEEPAIAPDATTEAAVASQYEEAIQFLAEYGIYHGKSATDLAAADPIERYQMALFVARLSTGWVDDAQWGIGSQYYVAEEWYDHDHDTSGFDDVVGTPAANYLGALSYASQKGIILGYGNRKFGPTDGITYQDALTMVCRTLGYKDLKWPWGFIEKAVQLNLTKGIPASVKYTDKLNRGEVAQIIYNALFATTKEGDTLAARNFNGELGWETIIITVAGKARFVYNDDVKFPPSSALKSGDAMIGFRVVAADGTLGDTTYFVKNLQIFNWEKHYERYIGYAFKALFTMDEDSNYVNLVSKKPLESVTVKNTGLFSKDADGKYPITAFLADKSLVAKYSKNTYLNQYNGTYGWTEFILKNGIEGGEEITVLTNNRKYAVNWIKGDILEIIPYTDATKADVEKKADVKTIGPDGKEAYYKTAWYYNDVLGMFFSYKTKESADGKLDIVGIDVLDEKDVEKLIDNQFLTAKETTKDGLRTLSEAAKTAYASLVTFKLNDSTVENYGIFEEYRLGLYNTAKVKCAADNNAEKDGFKITELKATANVIWDKFTKEDFPDLYKRGNANATAYTGIFEGSCDHGFWWFNEDGLKPENGDYVIYSADKATGEIKVVKIISETTKTDNDFVATGVVRAYDVPNRTVTIGDKTYKFDYDELAGNGMLLKDPGDITQRAAFTYALKNMFNQYVKYVICDGKLVYIELAGSSKELIVVDSYAGLSSDGYIVINGYKTSDLTYSQFRIGSYNGWVKGDYYYYPGESVADAAFMRGTLYTINSYDSNNKAYYVSTIALRNFGYGTMGYNLDDFAENGVKVAEKTLTLTSGYKSWNGTDYEKASKDDKYVFICNPIANWYGWTQGADGTAVIATPTGYIGTDAHDLNGNPVVNPAGGDYAPIIVYVGKGDPTETWSVKGLKVDGTDATVMINVDFTNIFGFNKDQYDLSYVLFLTYEYETAAYDSMGDTKDNGWYLLGASTYTARVFNFYNGQVETRTAVNKDLKRGYAYPAINGWIVNDARYDALRLNPSIPGAYKSGQKYNFGHGYTGDAALKVGGGYKVLFDKDLTSKYILSPLLGLGLNVTGLTGGTSVFLVSTEKASDGTIKITEVDKVDLPAFEAWIKAMKYDAADIYFWYIHTVDGNTVFYIERTGNTAGEFTKTPKGAIKDIMSSKDAEDVADIEITTTIKGTTKNDIPVKAALDVFTFEWVGPATKDTHEAVDLDDFHFGRYGNCTKEDWDIRISTDDGATWEKYYGSIVDLPYDPHTVDDTSCDLVKKVALNLPDNLTVKVPGETGTAPVDTEFLVKFTDSNLIIYTFKVVVTAKPGKLSDTTFTVNTKAVDYVIGSTDLGLGLADLAPANVGLIMDISRNVLATTNMEFHIGDYPEWVDWYVDHDGINGYGPFDMVVYDYALNIVSTLTDTGLYVMNKETSYTLTAGLIPDFGPVYPVTWTVSDPEGVINSFKPDDIRTLDVTTGKNNGVAIVTAHCGDREVDVVIVVANTVNVTLADSPKADWVNTPDGDDVRWVGDEILLTPTITLDGKDYTAKLSKYLTWTSVYTDTTDTTKYTSFTATKEDATVKCLAREVAADKTIITAALGTIANGQYTIGDILIPATKLEKKSFDAVIYLTAPGTLADWYTVVPAAADIIWSTSDKTIADVAADGTITGVSAGTATITGSSGTQTVTITVLVS